MKNKIGYIIAIIGALLYTSSVDAQVLRIYRFNNITKAKKEPYVTTRTIKTYPINYIYREGQDNPKMTFTPYGKKWFYLQEVNNGDTISSYIKRKNIYVTEYAVGNLPKSAIDRKFFGDGATIRIMKLDKAGHKVADCDGVVYVMDVNVGYYTATYPLTLVDGEFPVNLIGETKIVVDDIYGSIIDRYGKLRWNAKCVNNDEKPVIYYLPEQKAIYYNGKILHLQK